MTRRRRLLLLPALLLALCLCACTAPAGGVQAGGSLPESPVLPTESVTAPPAETPAPETPAPTAETIPEASPGAAPEQPEEGEEPEQPASGELLVNFAGELVNVPAWEESFFLRGDSLPGFTLSVPREHVSCEFVQNAWRFTFLTELENPAFLEVSFIGATDAAALLPSFMDSYLDFTDIEFSGAAALGRRAQAAETVVASGSSTLMKAWLLDVEGGVVAVVQSCALDQLTAQGSYFDAMLKGFSLLE